MRRAAAIIAAVIFAGVLAYSVGTPGAVGQEVTGARGMDPSQVDRAFWKIVQASKGGPGYTPTQTTQARGILTRAMPKAIPRVAPWVVRGGLLGVAAGIWVHNGITLYEGFSGPAPVHMSMDFMPAKELSGNGIGGLPMRYEYRYSTGEHALGYGVVTLASLRVTKPSTGIVVTERWRGITANKGNRGCYIGRAAVTRNSYDDATASMDLAMRRHPGVSGCTSGSPIPYDGTWSLSSSEHSTRLQDDYRFASTMEWQSTYNGPKTLKVVKSGPRVDWSVGGGTTLRFPVYQVGATEQVSSPLSGGFEATPEESWDFKNTVVADPEAPTVVPEEDRPQIFPDEDWDPNTDPFSPLNDPFKNPDGDPDKDGVPNKADEDPEGDGDSDGDGDPNEHPQVTPVPDPSAPDADPDGDQIPNQDDPDDDGDGAPDTEDPEPTNPEVYPDTDEDGQPDSTDTDDDGDGIPDKDDPEPKVPTDPSTLPQDHPYADPDEDGDPNHTDPDDDGDGIPDEDDEQPYAPGPYPDDHPDADPDGDGEPNHNDPDDDGDGVPDADDPAPYDPAEPGSEPDPGQDSDGDEVPDRIDPEPRNPASPARYQPFDADEDWIPDPYDPAPNDKTVPEPTPEPTSDSDGDGTPNQHDPYPTDPQNPSKNDPDLDKDGVPNVQDPDPYRPGEPSGGPSADPDGDGFTTEEDPYPNDPNQPGEKQQGCPIPRKVSFDLPEMNIGDVFPFSLILKAWDWLAALVGEADSLSFTLPFFGEVKTTPALDALMATIRSVIGFVAGVGMSFWFYRYISGRGSDS